MPDANDILTSEYLVRSIGLEMESDFAVLPAVRATPDWIGRDVGDYKSGTTVEVSRPYDFPVRDGPGMSSDTVHEGKVTVKAEDRVGVDVSFDSVTLSTQLSPQSFQQRVTEPASRRLKHAFDSRALRKLVREVPNLLDTRVTQENVLTILMQLGERLTQLGIPKKGRHIICTPKIHSWLVIKIMGLDDPATVGALLKDGVVTHIFGMSLSVSPNLPEVEINKQPSVFQMKMDTEPTWAAVKDTWVYGCKFNCQNTATDGGDMTLPAGSRFTVSGLRALNPLSHVPQPFELPFMLETELNFTSTATVRSAIKVSPPPLRLPDDEDRAHCVCTDYTVSNTAVLDCTLIGMPASGRQNGEKVECLLVYWDGALVIPQVSLDIPPGATGSNSTSDILLRVITSYDNSADTFDQRIDVQFGVKLLRQAGAWLAISKI